MKNNTNLFAVGFITAMVVATLLTLAFKKARTPQQHEAWLQTTGTIDVRSLVPNDCDYKVLTVTGVNGGDQATFRVPATSTEFHKLTWETNARYGAMSDMVALLVCNDTAETIDPPATTYRIDVLKR